ncbi:hypothetical protein GCM10022380_02810 [Amycolatopsis tucumanensis]|uniref:Uncharacterized protein n=1 Tax=Amycolatopsis tucumanensis TaxID=401106 RepID=A0ABP7HE63_9PSEU
MAQRGRTDREFAADQAGAPHQRRAGAAVQAFDPGARYAPAPAEPRKGAVRTLPVALPGNSATGAIRVGISERYFAGHSGA